MNRLYYGDNLDVQRTFADESVDLIYLDPPFSDEIASHPLIETEFGRFPAMQVVTIAELIHGPKPKLPPLISPVKKASRV